MSYFEEEPDEILDNMAELDHDSQYTPEILQMIFDKEAAPQTWEEIIDVLEQTIEDEERRKTELFEELMENETDKRIIRHKENIEKNHRKNIEIAQKLIADAEKQLQSDDKLKEIDTNIPILNETGDDKENIPNPNPKSRRHRRVKHTSSRTTNRRKHSKYGKHGKKTLKKQQRKTKKSRKH